MTGPIYFYTPIKPADSARASGLSHVAALLKRAIGLAFGTVIEPRAPQTYDPGGDRQFQTDMRAKAEVCVDELLKSLRGAAAPAAWITYHCYYKSPDLIGPHIADAFGCRYVIIEGSYASKRASGPWAAAHEWSAKALARADILLASTARDAEGLLELPNRKGSIIDFPPFIDVVPFFARPRVDMGDRIVFVVAAAMRDPRKRDSYLKLIEGLSTLPAERIALRIAGDGPFRDEIATAAKVLSANGCLIEFCGNVPYTEIPKFFAQGDIYAWPGIGEAYGLAYLEAQAAGLPVIAEAHKGVSAVVRNGVSGLLCDPKEPRSFESALRRLHFDPNERCKLGRSAQEWARENHSLGAAISRLRSILPDLVP